MLKFNQKRGSAAAFFLFFLVLISSRATAQTAPDQTGQVPQTGQLGSPFPSDHFWNRVGLEVSGGYSPVVGKGAGYFDKGWDVTVGATDRLTSRLRLLAELQYFGLNKNTLYKGQVTGDSNVIATVGVSAAYDLVPRAGTSPYLIGGGGYYRLVSQGGANAAGFAFGGGVRHRLSLEKRMEVFAEARYHYIASGSTPLGQISLLPVSAGIRW